MKRLGSENEALTLRLSQLSIGDDLLHGHASGGRSRSRSRSRGEREVKFHFLLLEVNEIVHGLVPGGVSEIIPVLALVLFLDPADH